MDTVIDSQLLFLHGLEACVHSIDCPLDPHRLLLWAKNGSLRREETKAALLICQSALESRDFIQL